MITSKQISGNRDRACFSIRLIHSSYFAYIAGLRWLVPHRGKKAFNTSGVKV